jgi:hypothetical protein
MNNRKNILTYTVAVLAILVTSASSSLAAQAQTYHGTFTGGDFLCNGSPVAGPTVTGTWNVSIDPKTPAQVTLHVFYNGAHHLAFGINALIPVTSNGGRYVFSAFGGAIMVTLDTNSTPAMFFWQAELGDGCPPQRPYNSLTYFGVASRGGG